jgi:hypothetical protein
MLSAIKAESWLIDRHHDLPMIGKLRQIQEVLQRGRNATHGAGRQCSNARTDQIGVSGTDAADVDASHQWVVGAGRHR